MKRVWKFPFEPDSPVDGQCTVKLRAPKGLKPVHVGMNRGQACLWAEVEPTEKLEDYKFLCIGTGQGTVPTDAYVEYLGTVHEEQYVWHIYVYKSRDI